MLKALEIRIRSREEADAAFLKSIRDAQAGKKVPPQIGVYFQNLEAVRSLLTDKRLELLQLIRKHSPDSINQLAKLAGRDFKNIHTDVMLLKRYGLVLMTRGKTKNKAAAKKLSVPYDAINIHAPL